MLLMHATVNAVILVVDAVGAFSGLYFFSLSSLHAHRVVASLNVIHTCIYTHTYVLYVVIVCFG